LTQHHKPTPPPHQPPPPPPPPTNPQTMGDVGGSSGFEHIRLGKPKFPEDHRARNALLAQQGYARIAAENAAAAEKKAAKKAAKEAARRKPDAEAESVRGLLSDGASGMTGGGEGKKRGLLGGLWRVGSRDGEERVVR
ncbi:hypothetical protein MMC11_001333, partial [Xylographa trunciseda]|nr:hypothetical protein [Xylographa trunciseda]